jgi:hypothetical protein
LNSGAGADVVQSVEHAANMKSGQERVLHIGGNTTDARALLEALGGPNGEAYDVE